MGLHFTSDDLARSEQASRAMLSSLDTASLDDWRTNVNRAVRELFGADKTVFVLPGGSSLFFSEDDPELAAGVESYVAAYAADGLHLKDPVVDQWQHMRRAEGVDAFSWSVNEQMIGRIGLTMKDSEMVSGVLAAHGVVDFTGTYVATPIGEVLLWILYENRDKHRFGEDSVAVLRALLPSFKAGLDAIIRVGAQRAALDKSTEPLAVFDMRGREIHRNRALTRLYGVDPESELIADNATDLAGVVSRTKSSGPFVPAIRTVATTTGRYELKASLLPPGLINADATVLVMVSRSVAAGLPSADVLRERYGITRRESEIALLLAQGLSNDQIADTLFVSPHTARRHTANLFEKLGVHTRKALALRFLADG